MSTDSVSKGKSSSVAKGEGSLTPRLLWGISLALVVITFLVFAPSRRFDFIRFDDPEYILENKIVQSGLTADGIKWAFKSTEAGNWHPLTWISHMLDYQLFGLNAGKYHLVNAFFHALNAAVLFLALCRMTNALWRSAFVAALFALHPLHVESVAWISERKDVLSAFFCFLTLLFYGEFARTTGRVRMRNYCLALLCCALGLLAKPMLVTLPCVLLLLDFWPLFRVSGLNDSTDPKTKTSGFLSLLLEKIPFFALSVGVCLVTMAVQKDAMTSQMPLLWRLGNALVSYQRYVQKMFWPVDLTFLYPHPGKWPAHYIITGAAFLIVVSALGLWLGRRYRYVPIGWFWYLGTLVPAIGLVQVGLQSMADRYTYIPLVGLFVVVTWGVVDLFEKFKLPKSVLAPAAIAVLAACTVLTARQLPYWKDSAPLYHRSLEVSARDKIYRQALQNGPLYSDFHVRLCTDIAQAGDPQRAEIYLKEVAQIIPREPTVHRTLGNTLAMQGKWEEAAGAFAEAIRLNPKNPHSHMDLGRVRVMQKKLDEGLEEFSAASQLSPDNPDIHFHLAALLEQMGRRKQAATHYREAVRCNPGFEEARKRLALLDK